MNVFGDFHVHVSRFNVKMTACLIIDEGVIETHCPSNDIIKLRGAGWDLLKLHCQLCPRGMATRSNSLHLHSNCVWYSVHHFVVGLLWCEAQAKSVIERWYPLGRMGVRM